MVTWVLAVAFIRGVGKHYSWLKSWLISVIFHDRLPWLPITWLDKISVDFSSDHDVEYSEKVT